MTNCAPRRRRLRQWLAENNCDAFVVTSPANVFYLSGFRGEGVLVIGARDGLSTDRRYEIEAASVSGRWQVYHHRDGHLSGAAEHLRKLEAKRVAFEANHLVYSGFETLAGKVGGLDPVPTRQVIERLRAVKDRSEIAQMTRAAQIMDGALERVARKLKAGKTERDMARELEHLALTDGAESMAFETILAFGPSAALPHARPGDRVLESGQVVTIDCGAKAGGYCSDITRTYVVGRPDKTTREVYQAVYDAQQAAMKAARAGMRAADLDAVARESLSRRGFVEEFSHGLGHGVGLEVHELPRVSPRSEDVLEVGMVITIEPGVYLEGWGGVRIEDSVVITKSGCEVLTQAPKYQLR
jgi:Xaa-Pro aminopeptidase